MSALGPPPVATHPRSQSRAPSASSGAPGALEAAIGFRTIPDGAPALATVQKDRPRLPWWIYRFTQARFHAPWLAALGRHLSRSFGGSP